MGEGRSRSKKKCLAYVAAFIVFQTAIILAFVLIVMKIKNPKVRLIDAIAVESFSSSNNGSASSMIKTRLVMQVTVKNTNFGNFKYDNSSLIILYNGVPLGEADIPRGNAKAKKTQKFEVSVDVSTSRVSDSKLRNEINNSRVLKLSSQAKLNGKVYLMKVMKKKKSAQMKCDWDLNLDSSQVENLNCN